MNTDVLVIGSGAGGAVTAFELATAGLRVLVVEEGRRHSLAEYGGTAADAMRTLYRRRGMTPIIGSVPLGYVEGRCLGGSTEINSAFWHRTPAAILADWKTTVDLADSGAGDLAPHFEWLERELSVGLYHTTWPSMTEALRRGADRMQLSSPEVPRVVRNCPCVTPCSSGCRTGGKQSMSRSLLPRAEAAGATIVTECRVERLTLRGGHATGAVAVIARGNGDAERVRIAAEHVFVCGGPTETPALLRRSGITRHVGTHFQVHPMLKIAALFPYETDAARQPIPLLQISGFGPGITMGGAHFSAGHLAMHMSENWPVLAGRMAQMDRMAMFHVAVKGTGKGSVTPGWFGPDTTHLRYELSHADHASLCRAAAALMTLLLRAGAEEVYPAIHGVPAVSTEAAARDAVRGLPRHALSLTTVHAFSTCRIGERRELTAADSFGRVWDYDNLYVNDASMLPDSPGVNPQGSIMALARRNALHFQDGLR